ncbi:MAG TPA: tyrosine--tRNA ligase, partial [Porphyromonadaceae bacterium]|nr:tyrosine--tRNA ligase [Porphyromonadaceae bacterium]HBU45566.1 tyrosine--tRNA ligase [Porphyromonadaceae bacterium]
PQFNISRNLLTGGIKAVDLLTETAAVFPSKGEMRKTVQAGGVSINKDKLDDFEAIIDNSHLIAGKYILAQRGKKNYYLLIAM